MNQKTWLITGASKGFGLEFVKQLLEQGQNVVATTRNVADLNSKAGPKSERFLPIAMDLTNETDVREKIKTALTTFKGIDVVINNAGYGQFGAVEEITDQEARQNFDVNVFGLLNVVRNVLPQLRKQGSGHIINISSIAGYAAGFEGAGVYCATKYAVSAISECLSAELKPLGIHSTTVYPGYFRTDFLTPDSIQYAPTKIAAYAGARQSHEFHLGMNHKQPGDPKKLVKAVIEATTLAAPPIHLFLGSDSEALAREEITRVTSELDKWKTVSRSTDF